MHQLKIILSAINVVNSLCLQDFRGKGSEDAIKKTLSRLTLKGTIKRMGHGLYVLPKKDPLFGEILPSGEEIAFALAKKEKIKIKPAGAFALHKLGLTLQVPTKLVYLTDGNSRILRLVRVSLGLNQQR